MPFMFAPCNPCCDDVCDPCISGSIDCPCTLQVDLAGFVNAACTDCATFNDTFIAVKGVVLGPGCGWKYDFPEATICGIPGWFLQVVVNIAPGVVVSLGRTGGWPVAEFRGTYIGNVAPCTTWNNTQIPKIYDNTGCDVLANPTCHLTSL